MARQDSILKKHTYCLKASTAKVDWPDERLPKKVFYGELQEGKRPQCGQKKRYKDTLKASMKDFDIPVGSWEQTAHVQERSKWQGLINKGMALYEKKRIREAERKHRERKANTNGPVAVPMTLTCSTLTDSLEPELA